MDYGRYCTMLGSKTILIVDNNAYGALDLSSAVEEGGGRVAGPVATLADALEILHSEDVAAAIVDCDASDGDASRIVALLVEQSLPLVIQTTGGSSAPFDRLNGHATVLMKPVDTELVLDTLLIEIGKAVPPATPIKLGVPPKQV